MLLLLKRSCRPIRGGASPSPRLLAHSLIQARYINTKPLKPEPLPDNSRQRFAAIVVGAGPAGVAAVGNLLEHLGEGKGDITIAWVDKKFTGGSIGTKWQEVPSNTKVGLFSAYARALQPFRDAVESIGGPENENAVTVMERLPEDKTCALRYAGNMLRLLTKGLRADPRVRMYKGKAYKAERAEGSSLWSVEVRGEQPWFFTGGSRWMVAEAPLVVYCTGAAPATTTLPVTGPKHLPLVYALTPSRLPEHLPADKPFTVGVIGASHSAILVLMNLYQLSQTTFPQLRVRWFARSPTLKYAVYKDGWILHDNTGLKGKAAEFAREQLDGDKLQSSEAGAVISRVDCSGGSEQEREAMERELPGCDYVVQAIGFARNKLPAMRQELQFDHETGGFVNAASGEKVAGLYGAGIAFPERVVDRAGNVEYAVGFYKFMNFLKRVVPTWVAETRR